MQSVIAKRSVVAGAAGMQKVRFAHPSVLALPSGRLLAAVDLAGAGVRDVPGVKGRLPISNRLTQGRVYASTDGGESWTHKHDYPFCNGCLLRDGSTVYLIGHAGASQIVKSADGGETWSKPAAMGPRGEDAAYALSPGSVYADDERIVAPFMRTTQTGGRRVLTAALAPELYAARRGADLMSRRSWARSEPVRPFGEWAPVESLDHAGVPFFDVPDPARGVDTGNRRWANRPGWAHPHVVRIEDPDHYWHDESGAVFHIVSTLASHRTQSAALMRARLDADGAARLELERAPSGRTCLFTPLPGGNLKFHVLYDRPSKLYWLLSFQVRDSMTRAERLPASRPGLPADECALLQLSFSRNLVDWCFAALVDGGAGRRRFDPTATVNGDDLLVAFVAPERDEPDAADTSCLTFGLIPRFRDLAYDSPSPPPA